MRVLVAVILLGLMVGVSFSADAQTRPATKKTETHAPSAVNRNLALIGGGVLGMVLASGAINLVTAGSMMYQGAAIAEALEAGAGLSIPVALLAGTLGALFGQDIVLTALKPAAAGEAPHASH